MAIPTMFHSGSSILEAKGASALAYLAEDSSSSETVGGHNPLLQTESETLMQEMGREETGITTVTSQTEGEQHQEFSPSSVNHSLFLPHDSGRVQQQREETGEGSESRTDDLGQNSWWQRRVNKSINREEERVKRTMPLTLPEKEDNRSTTCSFIKLQSSAEICPRPENKSQREGNTSSSFFYQKTYLCECPLSSVAGLCLHRLEASCCSDIYLSNGGSGCTELNSDPESVYIYAEGIKGCDSFCSMHQVLERPFDQIKRTENGCCNMADGKRDGSGEIRRNLDCNCNLETLCMYNEEKSSIDTAGYSIEAVVGSDYFCDSLGDEGELDSPSVNVDWEQSFDSDTLNSLVEAQWGSIFSRLSSASDVSCYTTDCGSEFSYCTIERSSSSEFEGPFSAGHCENASYDLYNAWTENSSVNEVGYESQKKNGLLDSPCCKNNSPLTLEPQGAVTHTDQHSFSPSFCEMVKKASQDRDQEKLNLSEGFLFHPQKFLQAKNSQYREGREYSVLRHIQNGSYGDVFSVRDKQTGFTCAAKRIPLCSFSWEEVETWSRLDSPRVLQLFGAVREGLNVVLFMDLKTGSLAQLLKWRGNLPEDLALYYHCQVLQALEHLHSRQVIHLDIKVDNVLLSKDGRECFLCDFGLSELLDQTGCSNKTFRGNGLRGTESHMSPEVARGDLHSDKADVWSSCCMFLHMLSGHQPWTRYYTHPLCLKIVSEPAPLWEIPPGCDPLTCDVIRGGLVKDPRERDSARKLLQKTTKALQAVSGFSDPVLSHLSNSPKLHPPVSLQGLFAPVNLTSQETPSPVDTVAPSFAFSQEELSPPRIQWVSTWREKAEEADEMDPEERGSEEESDWDGEEKLDKATAWMERYWGTGENLATTRNKHLTLLKDDKLEREDDEDLYTEVKKVSDKVEDQEQHREMADEADSENTGGTDGMVVCTLECLYEGQTRYQVTEAEEDYDEDDIDQEVETDLESLRELGSDWAEEEWEPFHRLQVLYGTKPQHNPYHQSENDNSDTEDEYVESTISREQMKIHKQNSTLTLTCHRSTCASEPELTDKNSDLSDDLSSGVFSSYSSLTDGQSFNVDWSVSTNQPPSCCFEGLGVDIWVEDVSGETLRIRERLKVNLGHIAVGISAQISMRTFSLATMDGKLVSPDVEVLESGMWLQCVPAPDGSTSWDWRVRDGKLEKQEYDGGASDTCSTLAA